MFGQGHECPVLAIGVDGTADAINAVDAVDHLACQSALQVDMIHAVLAVEPVNHASFNRLHNYHTAVEVGAVVHFLNYPIDEATQEVAFTKLDDTLWCLALWSRAAV